MIKEINNLKKKSLNFISNLFDEEKNVLLTNNSEASPFALCFAIHALFLLKDIHILDKNRERWLNLLKKNLNKSSKKEINNKSFRQLLSLTISSLIILNEPKNDTVFSYTKRLIPNDITNYLNNIGANKGLPGTGNMSMFIMIFCVYLQKFYNINFKNQISEWINYHKKNINVYGFWGESNTFKYSLFQNGYHQYEIFNYFNTNDLPINEIKKNILKLQDSYGHFSSIPGGTGCHDYDAIYFLTYNSKVEDHHNLKKALIKTKKRILTTQHEDGGFSESLFARPMNFTNLKIQLRHIELKKKYGRKERISRFVANLRPKNATIKNHWSLYQRNWNETNIFNTWFKILTLAKIEKYLDQDNNEWGFLNFPGIGFHNEKN